ncbi:MAG TPA: LecA/PA-IL family lectin, partial [Pyrinomonadaceae bacterium]|nr:LecA/PA-IL family lectin [Pyrinomonadaceae bacterium]
RPRDVERVEFDGRPIEEARYLTRAVQVELGPNWVDTGIDLRRGERVQVNATGTIIAGRSRITPGGLRTTDPNAPLPRAAEGVLIGAIGNDPNGPIVEIGLNREFVADRDGRLYLTANRSSYEDARGAFTAQVRREINFGGQRAGGNRRYDNNSDNEDSDDLFGTGSGTPAPARSRRTGDERTTTRTERGTQEKTLEVPGNSRGTDTGVDLRSGDTVSITATGNIIAGRRAGNVTPDGGRVGFGSITGTYPVANAGVGALIGYIRLANGQITQPFAVGSQQTITAPADGRLFLLINDDNYSDNSGSFSVRIVY